MAAQKPLLCCVLRARTVSLAKRCPSYPPSAVIKFVGFQNPIERVNVDHPGDLTSRWGEEPNPREEPKIRKRQGYLLHNLLVLEGHGFSGVQLVRWHRARDSRTVCLSY